MSNKKLDIKKDIYIKNRKASHEFEFLEKFTAGIVMKGTEIKALRMGKVNLQEAFCLFIGHELYVRGMHISPYERGSIHNHVGKADRKLLLTKKELKKLEDKAKDTGLTIVPTEIFINGRGWAKLGIALAKGKKLYDKRNDIKERDIKREMQY